MAHPISVFPSAPRSFELKGAGLCGAVRPGKRQQARTAKWEPGEERGKGDPTGPVTMVRRGGGDEQNASSGPNRGLWRQLEGLKARPGWVIFRVLGLGVCWCGGYVSILHDWAKADMQVPREEKEKG